MRYFINGNVPSLKNGKRWTGKYLISSKLVAKYLKEHKSEYIAYASSIRDELAYNDKPYKISFKFIRGSRHRFDYINAAQLPLDIMTELGIIDDDNADEVIPVFIPYEYNKEKPGVWIEIL